MQSVALISCIAEKYLKEKHRKGILLTGADLAHPCDRLETHSKLPASRAWLLQAGILFRPKSGNSFKKKKKKKLGSKPNQKQRNTGVPKFKLCKVLIGFF